MTDSPKPPGGKAGRRPPHSGTTTVRARLSAADDAWLEPTLERSPLATVAGADEVDPLAAVERRPWLRAEGDLGHGGMGQVHRVLDRKLRRREALKALGYVSDHAERERRRFVEEAQITAQLDHPNIPPVHDLWLDASGALCFTMKLVRGGTLTDLLFRRTPAERTDRDLEEVLSVLLRVCDAVSFAHSRGVIHRDLKPDNIMVGSHGQVYVMDWGCAIVLPPRDAAPDGERVTVARDLETQPLDEPGVVVGTAAYMAPEQAMPRNDEIDERTDVYLLGAVLYEILTQLPPHAHSVFPIALERAQRNEIPDPAELVAPAPLPPALVRIALRAMATDRADRYPSVAAFKADLEHALRSGWWFVSRTYPPGALVLREGEQADAAYIITAGTCEAFREEAGARVVLRRMGPGEVFGETAIFTAGTRTASVAALTELTVTVVTRAALEQAVAGDSWAGAFVRALALRFRELDDRLAKLRAGQPDG